MVRFYFNTSTIHLFNSDFVCCESIDRGLQHHILCHQPFWKVRYCFKHLGHQSHRNIHVFSPSDSGWEACKLSRSVLLLLEFSAQLSHRCLCTGLFLFSLNMICNPIILRRLGRRALYIPACAVSTLAMAVIGSLMTLRWNNIFCPEIIRLCQGMHTWRWTTTWYPGPWSFSSSSSCFPLELPSPASLGS